MLDFTKESTFVSNSSDVASSEYHLIETDRIYLIFKRLFDLVGSVFLLLPFMMVAVILLILNPFLNRGPVFYTQDRMGKECQPFRAWKFRSMIPLQQTNRGAFDPLEHDRITRLGRVMRKSRVDELPQIINVIRGEMSLIGPRPDALNHAEVYVSQVPGYRERCKALPGISGYAQTEVGYVDGIEGVYRKVAADLYYLRNRSIKLDLWIALRTFLVVLFHRGA